MVGRKVVAGGVGGEVSGMVVRTARNVSVVVGKERSGRRVGRKEGHGQMNCREVKY